MCSPYIIINIEQVPCILLIRLRFLPGCESHNNCLDAAIVKIYTRTLEKQKQNKSTTKTPTITMPKQSAFRMRRTLNVYAERIA